MFTPLLRTFNTVFFLTSLSLLMLSGTAQAGLCTLNLNISQNFHIEYFVDGVGQGVQQKNQDLLTFVHGFDGPLEATIYICKGQTIDLYTYGTSHACDGDESTNWSLDGQFFDESVTTSISQEGTYTATVKGYWPITLRVEYLSKNIDPSTDCAESTYAGPGPEELQSIRLYPNPATDQVNVQLTDIGTTEMNYVITDMLGRDHIAGVGNPGAEGGLNISLEGLSPGYYFLRFEYKERWVFHKIRVE